MRIESQNGETTLHLERGERQQNEDPKIARSRSLRHGQPYGRPLLLAQCRRGADRDLSRSVARGAGRKCSQSRDSTRNSRFMSWAPGAIWP